MKKNGCRDFLNQELDPRRIRMFKTGLKIKLNWRWARALHPTVKVNHKHRH